MTGRGLGLRASLPFVHVPCHTGGCPPCLDRPSREEARLKRAWMEVRGQRGSSRCELTGRPPLPECTVASRPSGRGVEKRGHGGGAGHAGQRTRPWVQAHLQAGGTGPRSSRPCTSNPIRFPKCPRPLAPHGPGPEQRGHTDGPGASRHRHESPSGRHCQWPEDGGAGPLAQPGTWTRRHRRTHMHAHPMCVRGAGSTHPDQPA